MKRSDAPESGGPSWLDRAERYAAAGLALAVAVLLAIIVHHFFWSVDRWVYLATDDSLANVSYVLAGHGRYGFLTSPIVIGVPRNTGLPDYGPWYFAIGSGLMWLFGYSLTLMRSIHLWVVVAGTVAARFWFNSPRRPAPSWALFGLGMPLMFTLAQWPMARPDSNVTLFTIAFVICAGKAIAGGPRWFWALAGAAAACAGFSHLIAWALMPAAGVVAALSWWATRRSSASALASLHNTVGFTFYGGLASALVFYAAFGFRFADQFQFVSGYQTTTVQLLATRVGDTGFVAVLGQHLSAAYGFGGTPLLALVATVWLSAVLLLIRAMRTAPADRRTLSLLLPPMVAWTAYLLSLGNYSNFHAGYTVLNHAMALWTAAALATLAFEALPRTVAARSVVVAVTIVAAMVGLRLITKVEVTAQARVARTASWVTTTDYLTEVLSTVPRGAVAWGTITFGIENPDRIQLVSYIDAINAMPRVPPARRESLAPQFLLWGYQNDMALVSAVSQGSPGWPQQMAQWFPEARYDLSALIAGEPYGVSRVYANRTSGAPPAGVPTVSVFDGPRGRWLRSSPVAVAASFVPAPAGSVELDLNQRVAAAKTYRAILPAGDYLLRVTVATGPGSMTARMISAGSRPDVGASAAGLAPSADVAAYQDAEAPVWLVLRHTGGQAFVSQFDTSPGANLLAIDAFVLGARESAQEAPNLKSAQVVSPEDWLVSSAGLTGTVSGTRFLVQGDATTYGYQAISKPLSVPAKGVVVVRVGLIVEQGTVCAGVLEGKAQRWIVPADRLLDEYRFTSDTDTEVRIVIANCDGRADGRAASRFAITSASVDVAPAGFYTDRLVDALDAPGQRR